MDALRKELETETNKRAKLEKSSSSNNREVTKLKDTIAKFERDLKKAHEDIRNKEWEISQLKSKQDKTIVEHVHVLEAAKKVTDGQLADAQVELQRLTTYVRSLEKAKTRLSAEAEDYARETERERQDLRAKEKALKAANDKISKAEADIEGERHAKEAIETQNRRLQSEIQMLQSQLSDSSRQLSAVSRSKDALEAELANLADDGETKNAMANLRRQYEERIHQLQTQLEDSDTARSIGERIKQRVDRQLMEIRRLVATSGPKDDAFRTRLLNALTAVDQEMEQEIAARARAGSRGSKGEDGRSYGNVTPSKRSLKANGNGPRLSEPPRTLDRQQDEQMRNHIQVLELQMIASDRVRQHLEASLRELSQDLDKSDGSKQSLQAYRARLAKENARLNELLADEAQARQATENAQLGGVKSMWAKFNGLMSEERESYNKLEESRRALVSLLCQYIIRADTNWNTACPATCRSNRGRRQPTASHRAKPSQKISHGRSRELEGKGGDGGDGEERGIQYDRPPKQHNYADLQLHRCQTSIASRAPRARSYFINIVSHSFWSVDSTSYCT